MIWAIFCSLSEPLLVFFHSKCFLNPLGSFGTHLKDPGETLFSVIPMEIQGKSSGWRYVSWSYYIFCDNLLSRLLIQTQFHMSHTSSWCSEMLSNIWTSSHHTLMYKKKKSVAKSARLLPVQCKGMQWIGKAPTALDACDAPECVVERQHINNRLKRSNKNIRLGYD